MTDLPPLLGRGERTARVFEIASGVLAVTSALLPWVQVPPAYGRLRETGLDRPLGVAVLCLGVALVVSGVVGLRRQRRFGVWWHLVLAVALVVADFAAAAQVRAVLRRDVPGVGVHPGTMGAGLRLLAFPAMALIAAAGYVQRVRRSAAG